MPVWTVQKAIYYHLPPIQLPVKQRISGLGTTAAKDDNDLLPAHFAGARNDDDATLAAVRPAPCANMGGTHLARMVAASPAAVQMMYSGLFARDSRCRSKK
ncbi:hypothetical protein DCC81_23545 [Chitinophaga parva]|uniref:Uncharacterized protein n=1 Tax=Chitinophaga parva TaxID=2169414 RepID=A0A2T7BEA2_9BACT|nr:hypothetical protein DCC81_23545 [Chitinophaga parva]